MQGLHRCIVAAMAALSFAANGADASVAPNRADAHAGHSHGATQTLVRPALLDDSLTDVRLLREDGRSVALRQEIGQGKTVVLAFIYTACTAICPVTSATLAQLQSRLEARGEKVAILSISIDPDQDTPVRLSDYAKSFGAGPDWHHYTGTAQASIEVQRAFDVYRGDKMNHTPVIFVRRSSASSWIRLDGFVSADELLAYCCGPAMAK